MCILYNYQILDAARDLVRDYVLTRQFTIGVYCALSVNLKRFHKTGKPHLSFTLPTIKQHPWQHKLKIMQVKDNSGYSPSRQHRRNYSYKWWIKGKVVLRNEEQNTPISHNFKITCWTFVWVSLRPLEVCCGIWDQDPLSPASCKVRRVFCCLEFFIQHFTQMLDRT